MIILDFGSAETCKNDVDYCCRMIDELAAVDTMRERIVIKWQLFTSVPSGVPPLIHRTYLKAEWYALIKYGYQTTASVFDRDSLYFLLDRQSIVPTPFIKIAARPNLYHLIDKIPEHIPVFVSVPDVEHRELIWEEYGKRKGRLVILHCIAEYPANATVYETMYGHNLSYSISDHTPGLYLYNKYAPWYWEKHYRLEDSTGRDAGPFAATPKELSVIL